MDDLDQEFDILNRRAEALRASGAGGVDPITMSAAMPPPPPGFEMIGDAPEAPAAAAVPPPPPPGFEIVGEPDSFAETVGKHVASIPGDVARMGSQAVRASSEALPAYLENMTKKRAWYDPRAALNDPTNIFGMLNLLSSGAQTVVGEKLGGEKTAEALDKKSKEIYAENPQNTDNWSAGNIAGNILRGGATMAPALAAGIATKNPALPLEIIGGQGFLEGYGKQREKGVSPGEAQAPALGYAAAESLPETLPLGHILKQGSGFFKRAVGGMVGEGASEAATSALESGIDKGTISPDMTLKEALEDAGFSAVTGAGLGAGMSAIAHPFMRGPKQEAPNATAFTTEDRAAPESPAALPDYSQGAAEKLVAERNQLLSTMDFLESERARSEATGNTKQAEAFAERHKAFSQEVDAVNQKIADLAEKSPLNTKAAEAALQYEPRTSQMAADDRTNQRALPDYSQTIPLQDQGPEATAKREAAAAAEARAQVGLTPDVDIAQRMAERPDVLAAVQQATNRQQLPDYSKSMGMSDQTGEKSFREAQAAAMAQPYPTAIPAPAEQKALPAPLPQDPTAIQAQDLSSPANVRQMLELIRYRQEQQQGPTVNAPDANATTPAQIGQEQRAALPAPAAPNPEAIALPDQSTKLAIKAREAATRPTAPSGETIALPGEQAQFQNPYQVTTLPAARKAFGLSPKASKAEIAVAAQDAGHDAVVFKTQNGPQTVPLEQPAQAQENEPLPAAETESQAPVIQENTPQESLTSPPLTETTQPSPENPLESSTLPEESASQPAGDSESAQAAAAVNLPDPKTMTPEAMYRAQKKIDKAFSEDNKAAPHARMSDEEYAALEDYARVLEEEIATRGKQAMREKLQAKEAAGEKALGEAIANPAKEDAVAPELTKEARRGLKEFLGDESGSVDIEKLLSWISKKYGGKAAQSVKAAHAEWKDSSSMMWHPGRIAKVLLRGNDSVLFGLGKKSPTAQKIAEMFAGKAGTGKVRQESYQQEILRVAGQFRAAVAKELHGLNAAEREALTPLLQNPERINDRSPAGRKAMALRKLLDKHQEYLQKSGIQMDGKKDYFPRFYDLGKITESGASKEEFLKHATDAYLDTYKDESGQPIIAPEEARELAEKWLQNIESGADGFNVADNEFNVITAGPPSPNNLKSRVLTKAADDIMRKWLIQDPAVALPMMAQSTTRRAAWEKRLGGKMRVNRNGKEFDLPKWTVYKEQLRKEGLNSEELHMLVGAVRSSAQIMPDALHPSSSKFLGALRTYSMLEFLNKVAWASLQETVMPMVRTGNVADGFKGVNNVIQHLLRNKLGLTKAQQAAQLSEWAAITGDAVEDMIMSSMTGSTGAMKRFEQTYIRGTLIPQLTMAQRSSATRIAQHFIAKMADQIVNKKGIEKSARYEMREMGIPDEQMDAFANWVHDNAEGIGVETLEDPKNAAFRDAYVKALHLFVDQTVMNPKASERQRFANAPGLVSFPYYLSSFIQSFQKNVLDRLFRMSKAGVTGKMAGEDLAFADRAHMLAPMAMMLVLSGLAIGLRELRDNVMYKDPNSREKDWFGKAMTYASAAGVTGGLDPYVNLFNSVARYNKDPVSAFSGPLIGKAASSLGSYITSMDPEHNSKHTNTSERKNARNFYDMVVMPTLIAGTTMIPNDIARYGAIYIASHPQTKEMYTKAVAGPAAPRKTKGTSKGRDYSEMVLQPATREFADAISDGDTKLLASKIADTPKDEVINAVLAMDMPELERMVFRKAAPNSKAAKALSWEGFA